MLSIKEQPVLLYCTVEVIEKARSRRRLARFKSH